VNQYQKGNTNLDFTEARDSEWQWHQLSRMEICTSLQTDNHASTPPLSFFTGQMPFLTPNQQRQSTEGTEGFASHSTQNRPFWNLKTFFTSLGTEETKPNRKTSNNYRMH